MLAPLNLPTLAAFVLCVLSALLAAAVLMGEGADVGYEVLFGINFVLAGVLGTRLLKQWRERPNK